MGGPALLGLQCVTHETQTPPGRPHQMILFGATLYLSHSVIKPTIRFQGNEWPSQFKGFSLRWRKQKATEMDLAASQALYQWLSFWGNMRVWTAVPSQHDSEWEELELMLKPSCSAELWICEWAMCCGENSEEGGGSPCLLYLLTKTYCTSAKQGLTTSLIFVKCSA